MNFYNILHIGGIVRGKRPRHGLEDVIFMSNLQSGIGKVVRDDGYASSKVIGSDEIGSGGSRKVG